MTERTAIARPGAKSARGVSAGHAPDRRVTKKAAPRKTLAPNDTTIKAMLEARAMNTARFASAEELLADLHAPD